MTLKGKKFYGVMKDGGEYPVCLSETKRETLNDLDEKYIHLVELEVTKVFTRGELIEIEK